MNQLQIRIGIDVGGTFTHAVAITVPDNKIIAHAVTPTTHEAVSSVAEGVVKVFQDVMEQAGAEPGDVCFVAHSTTQATNALLEANFCTPPTFIWIPAQKLFHLGRCAAR